jgi:hypothetical protein
VVEAVLTRDAAGEDRAGSRPGFDETDRKPAGGIDGGDAAARRHQQQRTAETGARELPLEAGEVARHQRLDVGVGAGRGEALVFAHFRRDIAGQRHRDVRQAAGDRFPDAALVIRIGERVQEADGNRLRAGGGERVDGAGHACFIERHQHAAPRVDALADRETQPPRHQWRRQIDIDVVLLEAVLVADFDHVAEAFGRQQRRFRALALDHGVGRQRRAMDDEAHLLRCNAGVGGDRMHGDQHAVFGRTRGGECLRRKAPFADFERDIGERAADVEAEPDCGH